MEGLWRTILTPFLEKKRCEGGGKIMTLEIVRACLVWCIVINMGLLIWWFLFFSMAHDWMYRMQTKWFKISVDSFDSMNYAGMGLFKLCIVVFNLVPYLSLRIVG
jgi:uncharacterized protein DUF6868